MANTEQNIRALLGPDLGRRVLAKMARERKKKRDEEAVEEITKLNDGYFVLPSDGEEDPAPLPLKQMSLDLDEMPKVSEKTHGEQ